MAEKTDLADILVQHEVLTKDQASQVRIEQINSGQSLEHIITDRSWANEVQIAKAHAELIRTPFVELATITIPTDILRKIPESVARHYTLIPFKIEDDKLHVAMRDPLDLQVQEFLEAKSGMEIQPALAVPDDILVAINKHYSVGMEKEVTEALKQTEEEVEKVERELENLDDAQDLVQSAPVARIVSTILEYAVKSKASDVHIEPLEDRTRVRFRIDGLLRERLSLPRRVHGSVVSRIKILSDMKIDEKRTPQDGRFSFTAKKEAIDLRVSTLPTSLGEKVVMRLLRKSASVLTLDELGLTGLARKQFKDAIQKPNGIVLITGPTGSGKTTTLRTALTMINKVDTNISTLEDPVEYTIPGVNQSQINPQAGFTFASGLRSLLRQDPDVVMVGEIRDNETMDLAIQAALTGHLVFSTIHTNSAAGALPRLLDMGAEPFLLASTIQMIVAQRLVRVIDPDKLETYTPNPEVEDMLRKGLGPLFPKDIVKGKLELAQPKRGKNDGPDSGFVGRKGIYEVLPMSEKIARLVLEHETSEQIQHQAVADGMVTLVQDGFLKVVNHETTVEEVLREVSE